jgi:hypothetical protein
LHLTQAQANTKKLLHEIKIDNLPVNTEHKQKVKMPTNKAMFA